ncbi:MAG: hypothetical protein QXM53_08915 [Thermofilaceae archaeon]
MKTWFAFLLIASLVAPLATVYVFQDDLTVVFNSWLSGEPKIMVKLEIRIPPAQAELCTVHVRRLPTQYRPTKTGFSEEVYTGVHRPGDTVVVKELQAAIVAKARIERGEYKVEYYEPVEYFVAVLCKSAEGVLRYGRIHEVFPRSLVSTHVVEVKLEREDEEYSLSHEFNRGGGYSPPISCNFYPVSPPPGSSILEAAECITTIRGPYLYSLPGLETAFGVNGAGEPRPSVVYIESFYDITYCSTCNSCMRNQPQNWNSAGRKQTLSQVTRETVSLSGRFRDRVYFRVRFRYEKICVGASFTGGPLVWIIYPLWVTDVQRSEVMSGVPYEKEYLSVIEPAPWHATGPLLGNITIWFTPAMETNRVHAQTVVSFGFTFGVFSIAVSFYEASRNDQMYTTPYISVRDVSERTIGWYYWWFTNNDPMTYEVKFSDYR